METTKSETLATRCHDGDIGMRRLNTVVVRCTLAVPVLLACVCAPVAAQTSGRAIEPRSSLASSSVKGLPARNGVNITGFVLAAATSKPISGALVTLTAPELPGPLSVLSDGHGAYRLTGLPAGHYTIVASKAGYLDLNYGQRQPLMEGEVIQLAEGEQYPFTACKLLRAGAIAGRIADDNGEPLAGATVAVMQYGLIQGERRLVQAGTAKTDDTGSYRVWGLMPGDYYVSVAATEGESVAATPTFFPGVGLVAEAKAVALGISEDVVNINFGVGLGAEIADR
jgi:hypothetical protein